MQIKMHIVYFCEKLTDCHPLVVESCASLTEVYNVHFYLHSTELYLSLIHILIPPDMMETVWCAVNRKTKNGVVLGGEQKLSAYEALQAITIHAAKQYGEEQENCLLYTSKNHPTCYSVYHTV